MSTSLLCSDLRALSPLSLREHDCIMCMVAMILASTALVDSMSIDKHSVALGYMMLCWVWLAVRVA